MHVHVPQGMARPRLAALLLAERQPLPSMGRAELAQHLRQLPDAEAVLARRYRYLPLPHSGLLRPCVVTDAASRRAALEHGCAPIARADRRDFSVALQKAFGERLAREAETALARKSPAFSARWRLTPAQARFFIGAALIGLILLILRPAWVLMGLGTLAGLFFLLQASLHLVAARHRPDMPQLRLLPDDALPTYTVLVPLFRERAVLEQLLRALARLDYPAEKLDMKLLVEETDKDTREALKQFVLPRHMEVLVVPEGAPQTKPRALNYGLAFARGELVTIFDAEDVPHPAQLRVAASMFAQAPDNLACLQAPLSWYNAEASFFSRMLAVEYANHFTVILPLLAALKLPLPLGGTSNHFRRKALEEAGGWDPHNVTEDADLGLRLARMGWRTGVLPRVGTLEEACTTFRAWRHQRARWIKGWLQTLLVHQRAPRQMLREVGWRGLITLYALLGAGVFAALAHPLFLGVMLTAILRHITAYHTPAGFMELWSVCLSLTVFVMGYIGACRCTLAGLARTGQWRLLPWLALLPFYWLLISSAAWLALWDFIRRPHQWRKTAHGHFLLLGGRR